MRKLFLVFFILSVCFTNLFASKLTILPQNVNFYYNPTTDYVYPDKVKIILENADLDANFSWYTETDSQWIKLDNLTGTGTKYYTFYISLDKSKVLDLSNGTYQSIVTFNTDIGVGILAVNLYIKSEVNIYKYGVNYLKSSNNYIKLPLPYSSNSWTITGNENYIINNNVLTFTPDNSSLIKVTDSKNNSFVFNINTIPLSNLYNFTYITSTATPVDFNLIIPSSNSELYVKITFEFNNNKESLYLTQSGYVRSEEPYITSDNLPLIEDLFLDLGKYIIKKSGSIKINVYNKDREDIVDNTYSFVSLNGTWQIVDHFQNSELRYSMNISDNNGNLSGWLSFNNKKYPFSEQYSYISNDGFYILSFAPEYPDFYIKIPYYLISDSYFSGFLMNNNNLVSVIEGYKE